MTTTPEIVTGDNITLAVTLKKSGATFVIAPSAVVKAALVAINHSSSYNEPVVQNNAAPGADWGHSLVIINLPSVSTSGIIYQGVAFLEIQVSENGLPRTWFVPVKIVTGQIT